MGTKVTGISIILASLTHGAFGLDEALVGVISSSVLAALVLVVIFVVIVAICFHWEKETQEKSKNAKGKHVQNGVPHHKMVANGRKYVPKPYTPHNGMQAGMMYGSRRGTPTMVLNGTWRGMESGPFPIGSHRGAPPGMMGGTWRGPHMAGMPIPPQSAYSAMNPFFLRPVIYIDESDDEDSHRSTVKEKKKRYRRSFNKDAVPPSSVVIKEMDSTEGKVKSPTEESTPQPDPQPSSSHEHQEKPKSPKKAHESRVVPIPHESFTKSDSGDEEAQIDEMFAFSVVAKEGDISFNVPEPTPPPRRSSVRRSPSPVRASPKVKDKERNYHFASVIRQNEDVNFADTSITATVEDRSNDVYASVIRKSNGRFQSEPNPLSRSMAERLEDIVQKRHDGWPTEFDDANQDEMYPPEDYGDDLSPTSDTSDKRFDAPSPLAGGSYTPEPPPTSLRQSRPAPATSYGGPDLSGDKKLPVSTNEGHAGSMKHAFTNQVLRELQMRHGSVEDDDTEDRNSRAVNFSEQPPEIIPSPRTSMNAADLPIVTPGVIPPAPPPPPPPPPPPQPKH